jgi:hypothetical protein
MEISYFDIENIVTESGVTGDNTTTDIKKTGIAEFASNDVALKTIQFNDLMK